ncbi:hypothetical protein JCM8547_001256 [Rhodosporidiobolus lusitaniae]
MHLPTVNPVLHSQLRSQCWSIMLSIDSIHAAIAAVREVDAERERRVAQFGAQGVVHRWEILPSAFLRQLAKRNLAEPTYIAVVFRPGLFGERVTTSATGQDRVTLTLSDNLKKCLSRVERDYFGKVDGELVDTAGNVFGDFIHDHHRSRDFVLSPWAVFCSGVDKIRQKEVHSPAGPAVWEQFSTRMQSLVKLAEELVQVLLDDPQPPAPSPSPLFSSPPQSRVDRSSPREGGALELEQSEIEEGPSHEDTHLSFSSGPARNSFDSHSTPSTLSAPQIGSTSILQGEQGFHDGPPA